MCRRGIDLFTGSRLRTGGIDYLFIQAVTSISNSTTYGRLPVNRIIGAKADSAGPQGKPEVGWLEVDEESAGQRLDNFLIRHLKGVPKTHVYRIIRSGEVRVNKGRAAADTRVAAGDRVRVPPVRVAERSSDAATAPAREFPALLEDDDESFAALTQRADRALYRAKAAGRGRLVSA